MTLGEIKIETLKLMFTNLDHDIAVDTLEMNKLDENYRAYLINMPGAINRCFSSLEEKRVLPSRSKLLNFTDGLASGLYWRYDLNKISDFFDIERIVRQSDNGDYDGDYEWRREANMLVFKRDWWWHREPDMLEPVRKEDATYTLIYKPRLNRITSSTSNDTELGIPDYIASYIPYFLKGELYRDDEPNEASEARNWYEQAMEELLLSQTNNGKINRVKEVYSQI